MRARECDPSNDPNKAHCVSAIVFTSTRNGALDIYLQVMNETNTPDTDIAPIRLTQNEAGGNGFPVLSPDGKRIVFDTFRLLPGNRVNISDLFLMNADGTDQRLLTVTADGTPRGGTSATWSPDGKWLAFHRSASGAACPPPPRLPGIPGCPIKMDPGAATWDSDIFIMRVHDADDPVEDPINITNTGSLIEDDADWSPDGLKIVFTAHDVTDNQTNSKTAEIYVLDLERAEDDPARVTRLTFNNEEERAPAWSPDGTRIAHMCRKGLPLDANGSPTTFEICVMNADGTGGQMRLTDNSAFEGTPTWSPDGEKIVFARMVALGRQQLFLIHQDGTGETQLESPPPLGTNLFANWGQLWVGGRGPG
jgi:Tol biopolymer transport system component